MCGEKIKTGLAADCIDLLQVFYDNHKYILKTLGLIGNMCHDL